MTRVTFAVVVLALLATATGCGGRAPDDLAGSTSVPSGSTSTAAAEISGGSPAERAVVRSLLGSLGSSDVVAVELTPPAVNAAGVTGEGVTVTVRAPAATDDQRGDGWPTFLASEVVAGYRDRAWAAKLPQPVAYGVLLRRPDGTTDDGAGGGEVAPVGDGSDFSVPPPMAATADDAAQLEQLLRAKAAANGDQIEQLHVLRPLTLALVLDVQVHDARAALCASANDYLSLIAPPRPNAGTGVVSDYAVSFHGAADQNAWGLVDALRAGFGTPIGACEGEDSSITAAAAPASAPAPAECARMLAALNVDATAAAQECQAAAAHAWLTATITNASKDPRSVACLADGLSAAGATIWTGADFRDPGSIGHIPGGGIDLEGGQTRSITWQVDQPPAASYRMSCRIDRSVGS